MKILKSKRKDNTHYLEIEEAPDVVHQATESAYKQLSKNAKIPGFRKGKITRALFEKHYGKEILIQEAVMDVIDHAYSQAIKELDLFVVDYPKNITPKKYEENNPLVFSCEVDVKPEVKLGKYKGIKVERENETVEDKDIDAQINQILSQHAQYEEVDLPAKKGDILRCNMEAKIDDAPYEPWTKNNQALMLNTQTFGEEFDKKITGLKKDTEKKFSVTYPADDKNKEVAGKEVHFSVTILEIREKKLPEFDDAFAKKASKFQTAEEYKQSIMESMNSQAKRNSENKLRTDILDEISKNSKVDIHEVMINREIDHMVRQFEEKLKQSGMNLEQYKKMAQKNDEEFKKEFMEDAKRRILDELVLEAIADKENIQVSDTDLEEEIKKWNIPSIKTDEEIKNYLSKINSENLKYSVRQQKTLKVLVENAKITKKKKK